MPEGVPIAERIIRVIAQRAARIPGATEIRRWDARNIANYKDKNIIVTALEASVDDGSESSIWTDHFQMPVVVDAYLVAPADGEITTDALITKWQGYIQKWIVAHPTTDGAVDEHLTEITSPESKLARDCRLVATGGMDWEDGCVFASVTFMVHYATNRGDPYNGPGITLLEE